MSGTKVTQSEQRARRVEGDRTSPPSAGPAVSEGEIRALLDATDTFVALLELRGRELLYVYGNEAVNTFFGVDDVRGMSATDLGFTEGRLAVWRDRFERVLAEQRPLTFEYCTGEPADQARWYECSLLPLPCGPSSARRLGMTSVEVTGYKRSAEELREARRAAEAANDSRSEFLANMSHELRTPMTAILGLSELLLRREGDEKKRSRLSTIKRNCEHLTVILNDILDISRIDAGRLDLVTERFSPVALIEEVRSLMMVRASEKGLPLRIRYPCRLPEMIESDRTRVRQILVNLVSNAIKFTEEGHVAIDVSLERSGHISVLRLVVEDTGIGMPAHQVERMFSPFTQGDSSVQRRHGGTGLGLTICRRLVDMLGGRIDVESEARTGSRFSVTLPAGELAGQRLVDPLLVERRLTDETHRPAAPELEGPALEGWHVLVADDQPEIRTLLCDVLENAGARVSEAAHGMDALSQITGAEADADPFDVLLLDMQMPVLDGFETVQRLRARGDHTRVVAVTASAMRGDRERCLQAGCDDYLAKPLEAAELLTALRALERGTQEAAPSPPGDAEEGQGDAGAELLPVLIVEDNDDLRELLGHLIEALGCQVRAAGTGREALELVERGFLPRLSLIDLGLPDTSGIELLRVLQSKDELEGCHFAALSGRSEEETRRAALEAGFHDYQVKPVDVPVLEGVLERMRR